jgi:diketogulonate reductase-like aldo/keto reductase
VVYRKQNREEISDSRSCRGLTLRFLPVHWPVAFYPVPIDPTKRGWDNEDIDDSNNGQNIDESVSIHEVWELMEELVQMELVKNIGVCNMPLMLLHELMAGVKNQPPVVNQIELHPYLQQEHLIKYCQRRNIHVQAYSPLGTPGYKASDEPTVLDDPLLRQIAAAHSITPAQLCIAWALQRGTSVVVKSVQEARLVENMQMSNGTVRLSEEEMSQIASLDRGYRFFRPQDWWGDKNMAVFD